VIDAEKDKDDEDSTLQSLQNLAKQSGHETQHQCKCQHDMGLNSSDDS
jgi:glutathionylspermidine synthase